MKMGLLMFPNPTGSAGMAQIQSLDLLAGQWESAQSLSSVVQGSEKGDAWLCSNGF